MTSCAPASRRPGHSCGTDSVPHFGVFLSPTFRRIHIKAHTPSQTDVLIFSTLSPTFQLPASRHHSHSVRVSFSSRLSLSHNSDHSNPQCELRLTTTHAILMTHTYECLVMPPIAPSSLPPPIPIYRTRSGLASEPLCLASEVRDGRVPFPRSDERMHLPGGSPHKDDSAQPQPPGDNAPTRRRTVRRKKSSLGLREDFLKSSEGTSPATRTPDSEPSPVEPEPAQS